MSAGLLVAHDAMRHACASFELTLRTEYPVGSDVEWLRHSLNRGVVIAHGANDRVQVRNKATGAEYWIRAYQIIDAYRAAQ